MYKVTRYFTDLQDNGYVYRVGDSFPRPNLQVSDERLKELSTSENKQGVPLIEEIIEESAEKPLEAPEAPQKPKRTRKSKVKKDAD